MLQRLGDHVSACLQRADQCKEAAALETDERVKTQLLEMERQWRQKKSAGPSRRSQFHSRRLHLAAGLRRLIPFHVGLHTARFGCRHFGSGKAGSCESDGQPNSHDNRKKFLHLDLLS